MNRNFKFFRFEANIELTVDLIKKQYRKLAFKHHPDVGGSIEDMQSINSEYEIALEMLSEQNNKHYTLDTEFVDLIDKLIKMRMQGVIIEICGWFVYVSGDTKPYKEQLRALKLFWNGQKVAWYYKPNWYVKKDNTTWGMDRIRGTFGSNVVANGYRDEERVAIG